MDADKPVCPVCGETPRSEQGAAFIETFDCCVMCYTQESEQDAVDAMAEMQVLDDWDPMDPCGYYDDRGR